MLMWSIACYKGIGKHIWNPTVQLEEVMKVSKSPRQAAESQYNNNLCLLDSLGIRISLRLRHSVDQTVSHLLLLPTLPRINLPQSSLVCVVSCCWLVDCHSCHFHHPMPTIQLLLEAIRGSNSYRNMH